MYQFVHNGNFVFTVFNCTVFFTDGSSNNNVVTTPNITTFTSSFGCRYTGVRDDEGINRLVFVNMLFYFILFFFQISFTPISKQMTG